jgi:tRNA(fMet)-specific endonuclease VapC
LFLLDTDTCSYAIGGVSAALDQNLARSKPGTLVGLLDTMIAAHALALDAILIANNQKHFQRIKALQCENWVR